MADIRCPSCGKNNPDFLDNCQFCQTPLKPESMVHIGDKPTKKNTGELENVLPEWLRDVRQQARNSAEADAAQAASQSKAQKEEPPDLLAGLAFQAESADEEEVPDWLSSLGTTTKEEKKSAATPAAPETDFFAQFNEGESSPKAEPAQEEETPSFVSDQSQPSEHDELSAWFTKASEEPAEPFSVEPDLSQINSGWEMSTNIPVTPEQPAPKEEEDLSWLHNLEEEAKKTGELGGPKQEKDWFAEFGISSTPEQPSGQEDLSWLNNLGALPPTERTVQQPFESKDDLSWLNNLGGTPVSEEPVQSAAEPKDDLSWLNSPGETPLSEQTPQQSAQPQDDLSWLNAFKENPPPSQPPPTQAAPQEDLSWLNQLSESTKAEPFKQTSPDAVQPSPGEDLSWLNNLQGSADSLSAAPFADQSLEAEQPKHSEEPEEVPHVAPFTPRHTAPLTPEENAPIPDWLKSATEGPSMPLGADALDQFREDYRIPTGPEEPFSWKNFVPEAREEEEQAPRSQPEHASVDSNLPAPAGDSATLSNQDVDSLFSVDMPDWLSHPTTEETAKPPQEIGIHAEGGEALAPADLPSWVQAMRPVEAVISETAAVEEQPTEREGPLAGFKGIIPAVPIGSARRPQPIPLKLQATDEQQASAAIMEQILVSETSPRALLSAPTFASQRTLRIGIAVLIWVVLGAMILLRTQIIPVSPILPPDVDAASKTVESIPDNSPVLVVLDYEPSLAGEMEATSGPLLDKLVLMHHPPLSFITTSPNGSGLVERLLRDTDINTPAGLGYSAGNNYFNLGYLPGGESGVLSFIQSPQSTIPSATVPAFSDYKAIIMLTDHADSARAWIEQLQALKQADPTLVNQPLLIVSSAQAAPMLQPYAGSGQINGLISGIADAARFEFINNSRPGIARAYWDAFGAGIILAITLIVLGSLWSLFAVFRAHRIEAGEA
jgi:hypothetical protein